MIMRKIRGLSQGQTVSFDEPETLGEAEEAAPAWPPRDSGPWDISEVTDTAEFIDLGSLMLKPRDGVEVRVEVHQESGQVVRMAAVNGDSAVVLQPFAAAKSGPIWPELRHKIEEQAAASGAQTQVVSGRFGEEILISDGSRWVGIDGPRWLLRCVYTGPAKEPGASGTLEDFVRDIVVVRGNSAMPPGEALPIKMPAQPTEDTQT
jgi:hypothetical protein